jgi:hypothetical protein
MSDFQELLIDALATTLVRTMGVSEIVKRSLNPLDVHGTLGICLDEWLPLDYEMGGDGSLEPSTSKYLMSIQHLVKYGVQEDGERLHREVAKAVRLMLYRDPDVQVSLRSLVVQDTTRRERILKFYVVAQRYASNEMKGTFVFLSSTEFVVETETVTTS